jgi:hypothetical protein
MKNKVSYHALVFVKNTYYISNDSLLHLSRFFYGNNTIMEFKLCRRTFSLI